MYIKLYQVNMDRDEHRVAFEDLEHMRAWSGDDWPDGSIYDLVFEGHVATNGDSDLETIFKVFSTDTEYRRRCVGRSMAVSDVVELPDFVMIGDRYSRFWYCDSFGFKPVMFDTSKTKKAAPAATGATRK